MCRQRTLLRRAEGLARGREKLSERVELVAQGQSNECEQNCLVGRNPRGSLKERRVQVLKGKTHSLTRTIASYQRNGHLYFLNLLNQTPSLIFLQTPN